MRGRRGPGGGGGGGVVQGGGDPQGQGASVFVRQASKCLVMSKLKLC